MTAGSHRRLTLLVTLLLTAGAALLPFAAAQRDDSLAALQRGFANPPEDARIMMRWWWFGPSITKAQIEKELRLMKEGGIGGVEVQPVYPLQLDDPARGFHNYPYLGDEFIAALRFAGEKARELGLRMDVTLGSGWPFGGPAVPVTEAATRLRVDVVPVRPESRRVPFPHLDSGEKFLAAFVAPGEPKKYDAAQAREAGEIRDGAFYVPAGLNGPHVVLFFLSSRTGMQVKRPAIGGEGYVVDHYNAGSIQNYLSIVGERLLDAFPQSGPYAFFTDSLEVYGSDWAADFLEEFQRRRGYDIKPLLPALLADIGPRSGAIRHDWGRTLTELVNERFLVQVTQWAHRNGVRHRAQVYGIPPASLASNRLVDLAEGEHGPTFRRFGQARWASSANHLFGRPVTSSETWTWLHSPSFRATPLDMKAEADRHFLQGINQLIGHGWPSSPEIAGEPGWRFYAAAAFNPHNPWWPVMPDVARYLQRVSFLLRQGKPVNDVALYLPTEDVYAKFAPGRATIDGPLADALGPQVIAKTLDAGYGFDFIDSEIVENIARAEKGTLAIGENRYRIVILPGLERISPDALGKLEEFVKQGGTLIATRRAPSLAPGYRDAQQQSGEVRAIAARLFQGPGAPARLVTDEERQLGPALQQALAPDVAFSSSAADLGFIHRKAGEAEIYFVANTSSERREVQAAFRVDLPGVEAWDALTGRAYAAKVAAREKGSTVVTLALAPYESQVVVFSRRAAPAAQAAMTRDLPAALDLSTDWNVTFPGRAGAASMVALRSWTEDEATRYFSGAALYEKSFEAPAAFVQGGAEIRLDFGAGLSKPAADRRFGMEAFVEAPVRDAAVVFINGKRAGAVWCAPFSVDVTGFLRAGKNVIRVEVFNTAINALAGASLPDYRLLNLRYGERFQPQDMQNLQPLPSGLFGPIRLTAQEARAPVAP